VRATAKQSLLRGITDKAGFHQQRRDIWRTQHAQAGMLRQTFMQRRYAAHLLQHFLGDVITHALRVTKLQVQYRLAEVRVGLTVGQQVTCAAQQLRLFLFLLQPVSHLVICATVG